MIPINNSDTAWLVVSDFNQDNNLPYEDLRNDILNPKVDQWVYEHYGMSLGNYPELVGGGFFFKAEVGNTSCVSLVTNGLEISVMQGKYVGDEEFYGGRVGGN